MRKAWRKVRHCTHLHVRSGVEVEMTANPDALRRWYVRIVYPDGDNPVADAAFAKGCAGGFFALRAAKRAVEVAAVAIRDGGRSPESVPLAITRFDAT